MTTLPCKVRTCGRACCSRLHKLVSWPPVVNSDGEDVSYYCVSFLLCSQHSKGFEVCRSQVVLVLVTMPTSLHDAAQENYNGSFEVAAATWLEGCRVQCAPFRKVCSDCCNENSACVAHTVSTLLLSDGRNVRDNAEKSVCASTVVLKAVRRGVVLEGLCALQGKVTRLPARCLRASNALRIPAVNLRNQITGIFMDSCLRWILTQRSAQFTDLTGSPKGVVGRFFAACSENCSDARDVSTCFNVVFVCGS